MLESRGKFAGQVPAKHRALPVHQRVIFAEAQPRIELPKGVAGAGNGFVGEQVGGEGQAETVGSDSRKK